MFSYFRCKRCFQPLEVSFSFTSTLEPVILEVRITLLHYHYLLQSVFLSCLETVTPCSHVVSKNILKARYKIVCDSVHNNKSLLLSSRCLPFYQFFFSFQEKFCKIGVIVFIGLLRNMRVKCDLLRGKK